MADKRSFYKQLGYFSNDFEVFAYDFKGFGENKGMEYPYALDDYINDLKEYFYKNNIICPSVIAHSFGGRVVIKSASQNARLYNKIVLTGSAGLKPRFSLKKAIKKATFKLLKPFIKKEKLKRFYSSDYLALPRVMQKSFIKIVNEHLDSYTKSIKNKTLIINGSLDRQTPVYMAKRLNKNISNSKLIILKGAGHFAFIDKPFAFNKEVKEFLL